MSHHDCHRGRPLPPAPGAPEDGDPLDGLLCDWCGLRPTVCPERPRANTPEAWLCAGCLARGGILRLYLPNVARNPARLRGLALAARLAARELDFWEVLTPCPGRRGQGRNRDRGARRGESGPRVFRTPAAHTALVTPPSEGV